MSKLLLALFLFLIPLDSNAVIDNFFSDEKETTETTQVASQPHSWSYKRVVSTLMKINIFSEEIGNAITSVIAPLVLTLITLYVLWLALNSMKNEEGAIAFAYKAGGYILFACFCVLIISSPIFSQIMSYFVRITLDITSIAMAKAFDISGVEYVSTGSSLADAFKLAENSILKIDTITTIYDEKLSSWFDWDFHNDMLIVALYVIFYGILAVFFFMFVSLIGIMMFLVALAKPLAILAVVPWFRPLFKNLCKALLTFGFGVLFVALANALTLFVLGGVIDEFYHMTTTEMATTALMELIIVGLVALFFHVKATTFAAMVTGSQVTDFGQATAVAVGGAYGAMKAQAMRPLSASSRGLGNRMGNFAGRNFDATTQKVAEKTGEMAQRVYSGLKK